MDRELTRLREDGMRWRTGAENRPRIDGKRGWNNGETAVRQRVVVGDLSVHLHLVRTKSRWDEASVHGRNDGDSDRVRDRQGRRWSDCNDDRSGYFTGCMRGGNEFAGKESGIYDGSGAGGDVR